VVVVVEGLVGGAGAGVVMTWFEMFVEQITRDPPPLAEPCPPAPDWHAGRNAERGALTDARVSVVLSGHSGAAGHRPTLLR
ncbi:MAG: hypothetical protein ABJC24_05220, partial [Chloroflexota bacterium]